MSTLNHTNVAFYSGDTIDKVLYADTFTFSAAGTYTESISIGGQFVRPIGIYSTDGGSTWADIGANTNVLTAHFKPLFSGGVNVQVPGNDTVQIVVSSGLTYPVIVKMALLAVDNPSPIPTAPTFNTSNKVALALIDPKTKLPISYKKIVATQIYTTQQAGGVGNETMMVFPHGLGYLPLPTFWVAGTSVSNNDTFSGNTIPTPANPLNSIGAAFVATVLVDATNLYLFDGGTPGATEYLVRMYKQ